MTVSCTTSKYQYVVMVVFRPCVYISAYFVLTDYHFTFTQTHI